MGTDLVFRAMELERARILRQIDAAVRELRGHTDRLATGHGTHEAMRISVVGTEVVALTDRLKTITEWYAVFSGQIGPSPSPLCSPPCCMYLRLETEIRSGIYRWHEDTCPALDEWLRQWDQTPKSGQ